ncbi:MAG: hypothetical protein IFK94_09415 [Acidobacteria bacterium]|uniref:FecR protein domain-containing protein n=1 Tax=Candidatus Polarisedimenticola svalbardensis TaxID=2886004 RepID=A0A8J6XXB0_9BACT|nr:hypothetical protein [Candidatus Polarisedimenticola svalbardensis]
MAKRSSRSTIILDWVNVTYRSAALWICGALILIIAGGFYWYHATQVAPRDRAVQAIEEATGLMSKAVALTSSDPRVLEARVNARETIEEAESAFASRDWDRARQAAMHSATLSRKAIDLVEGKNANSAEVRFLHIEGDVKVKRAGEFSWETAHDQMVLNVGDQLKTTSSGSAQLIYFDGTKSTVDSGSLLEIRQLFEDPTTKERKVSERLGWGSVQVSTRKQSGPGSEHEVSTEVASATTSEEGEMKVRYDKDQGVARFDAYDGKWGIKTQESKKALGSGQTVDAYGDGRISPTRDLPTAPRLLSPSDQKMFVFENPAEAEMTLRWEKVAGAREYRLTISERNLFTDPAYQGVIQGTSIAVEGLSVQSYYWKVETVMPDGGLGPPSAVRRFRVTGQSVRDSQDNTPPPLEITDFLLSGPMVIVNGLTEPGAGLWIDNEKIDVYEDGTFYAVVRLRKEGENIVEFLAQDAAGNEQVVKRRAYVETY